jgi:UDP-2,3-diacylglucosamine pyrophosphatase LpxH
MFIVYGAICVFGLEPAYRFLKRKDVPTALRGLVYMCIILFMECSLGWVLMLTTGYSIWYYAGPGTLFTYTSLAIAPMWYICGLVSENVIVIIDSLDELKMNAYGLDAVQDITESAEVRDRIAVISDIHIGPRKKDGGSEGWFYGIYEVYFTIMLYKLSMNKKIRELVFLGDLFDTWNYPPERQPDSIKAIIENWKDSPFMAPLLNCISKFDAVWYIAGNHDMGVQASDLTALSKDGKSIRLVTPKEFNELHANVSGCALVMEHGNDADFFNAPDVDGDNVLGMPFGYFVSRLVMAAEDFDIDATFRATFRKIAMSNFRARGDETEEHRMGRLFINLFVDALVAFANSKRDGEPRICNRTEIIMPEGMRSTTVAEVKTKYSSLLSDWRANKNTYFFAAAGKNGLHKYARKKFGEVRWILWFKRLFCAPWPEMIVLMGHTHYGRVEYVLNREKQGVYANSGCVCRNKKQAQPHWVEIRDTGKGCLVKLRWL